MRLIKVDKIKVKSIKTISSEYKIDIIFFSLALENLTSIKYLKVKYGTRTAG